MTTDGVVVESTAVAHWAWVGLRLTPAPTLAESRAYPDVEEPQLRAETSAAERAWLSALWSTDFGARWELRYTNEIADLPVASTLLGRVQGRDLAEVTGAATALRDRLARTPRHVRAEPILDADQLKSALTPGWLDQRGQFELRKPLDWAWCTRPGDANRKVCFAVAPLVANDLSWEPVWHELANLPSPTTVGFYLEPYQPSDRRSDELRKLVSEYRALATERRPSPLWTETVPPDLFAARAAPGYVDAARRYARRCYRMRISVASAGPLDPSFAELLAATAGGATVCRVAPADTDGAWRNLASVERDWLDDTYRQGSPAGELNAEERILCDVVDLDEASAAFRLPREILGHVPLFADRSAQPASVGGLEEAIGAKADTTRKRIFVSYVREDLALVDKLVHDLRAAGYDVWTDRSRLLPGRRWKSEIKKSIADVDYFLACFSPRYWKDQSYMNEELIAAVERFRLMPRNRDWFIPAMLAECELPDHVFGPNETIAGDMQYADFGKDWDEALRQVIALIGPPEKH
ncbi:MAG TPA: toll/interleukin-1 receptor domain-containing protein [Pseudonocardiaceae bacterium]|nr:toll/interleukin-1 receptor domain-containing protein [Pseudonocardiaceae bacterium]